MKDTKHAFARNGRFNRAAVLASLAIAAVTAASPQAFAAVICSAAPFRPIPANIDGIYVNFVTGSAGSSAVAGWDFNAYASGSANVLRFFSSGSASNTTRYVGMGTTVYLLASGTMVDASSPIATTGTFPAVAFLAGVSNGYVGVAFKNEGTSTTNYGWVSLTTTGPNGFPATINQYCFSNNGTAIMAGGEKIFKNGFDS